MSNRRSMVPGLRCTRFTSTLAVAIAAIGGIWIATASAAKLTTKAVTTAVAPGDFALANAKCGAAKTAISGGFEVAFEPLLPAFTPIVLPAGTRRFDRIWQARGLHVGGGAGSITSFAYCRDDQIRSHFERVTVAGNAPTAQVASRCPKGTTVLSGGAYGELNTGGTRTIVVPNTSRRVGKRTWEVRASNAGGMEGGLHAFVYCHKGDALRTRRAEASVSGTGVDYGTVEVTAECKAGERFVSGGYDGSGWVTNELLIHAAHRVGKRRWSVSGSTRQPTPAQITSYAYCAAG